MTHLHGGFVAGESDGNPAVTPDGFGPGETQTVYYPNQQPLLDVYPRAPPAADKEGTQQVGWAKAAELTKVARSDGKDFESAIWLHKARAMPQQQFKHEVEKHLTGKDPSRSRLSISSSTRARSRSSR